MSAASSGRPTEPPPGTVAMVISKRPWCGVFGVLLGASVATAFGRLLSIGLADLRGALHLDYDAAAWIGTAYNAALMFIGPFSVYLGGLLGARRVLLACAMVFTIISLALPLVTHLPVMLVLLVLAGLTAGTFYPLTLSFVLTALPPRYVLFGIGAYAVDIIFSAHLTTYIEAWYMNHLSWHWLFWNNVVLTLPMMLLIYIGIPPQSMPKTSDPQLKPDWGGFLYISLGLAMLYVALDQGERLDWLHSPVIVAFTVTGCFLVLASATQRIFMPNPLIRLGSLVRRETILLGTIVALFRFGLLLSLVLVPAYLGSVQQLLPQQIGPVLAWNALPQVIFGALAIYLLTLVEARVVMLIGFGLIALVAYMNMSLTSAWAGNNFFASQMVLSVGQAFAFNGMVGAIILNIINAGGLERPLDILTYSGFFHTVRLFGGQVGAIFLQHTLITREKFHSNMLGLSVQTGDTTTMQRLGMLSAGMTPVSPGQDVAHARAVTLLALQVRRQAFTLAILDCLLYILLGAALAFLLTLCMRRFPLQFKQLMRMNLRIGKPAPAPQKTSDDSPPSAPTSGTSSVSVPA
jgi:MFS transporter, DHA2 family, multidrug resistance protein